MSNDDYMNDPAARAGKSDLLEAPDPIANIESRILAELRAGSMKPHQKLQSGRQLAKRLNTPHSRVHQAIKRLCDKGYLYSRHGSGVFVADAATERTAQETGRKSAAQHYRALEFSLDPHEHVLEQLRIRVPVANDPSQVRIWQKVLDRFSQRYPFVHLLPEFAPEKEPLEDADVSLVSASLVPDFIEQIQMLDEKRLEQTGFDANSFLPGLLQFGALEAGLKAVPVLRTTTILAANLDLLSEIGYETALSQPADVFGLTKQITSRLPPAVRGLAFTNVKHFAKLYGVHWSPKEASIEFDESRLRQCLSGMREAFSAEDIALDPIAWRKLFLQGQVGLICWYWNFYPFFRHSSSNLQPLPLPLVDGGYPGESAFWGVIPQNSERSEDAMLLLGYLVSEEAQRIFAEEAPWWLSVHRQVLEWQHENSPFPQGSLIYDFDPRVFEEQMNPQLYDQYNRFLNTEAIKCITGMQSLTQTIQRLKAYRMPVAQ